MITNGLAEDKCKLFLKKGFRVNDDGTILSNTGKMMDKLNRDGYIHLAARINGKTTIVKAHHLVFYNTHGYVPEQINHINHNRKDNRIDNLEPSDALHNNQHREIEGKCYHWHKRKRHWSVERTFNSIDYHICLTKDEKEAERLGAELRRLKTLDEILEFKKLHKKDRKKGKCYRPSKLGWAVSRTFNSIYYYICYTKDEKEAERLGMELRSLNTLDEILQFKELHKSKV